MADQSAPALPAAAAASASAASAASSPSTTTDDLSGKTTMVPAEFEQSSEFANYFCEVRVSN